MKTVHSKERLGLILLSKIEGFTSFLLDFPEVSGVLLIILICILVFFSYHLLHLSKRGHLPIESKGINEILGPKEWEQEMINLSCNHKNVRWMKFNYIVGNYNQEAYKKLNLIRHSISEISSDIISLIPSARWLYDNFQMMYREIKKVKTTGTSYETLPILRSGEYRGYPRIYVVARKMVALSGGYLNEENIILMMKAYQKGLPLANKELWVLPEMIGLCILERALEVSEDIILRIKTMSKADRFVKKRLGVQQSYLDVTPLLYKLEKDCRENASFHCHVIYLLKNMSFEEEAIQKYMAFHCKSEGKHINLSDIFKEEGKLESHLESNIRTLIVSLREINQIDEEILFEELSLLENILSKDPDGVYPFMDSDSRGIYRGVIEKLSLKHKIQEGVIGEACLELAEEGREDINCSHHVGAYLVEKGYPILKAKVLGKTIPKIVRQKRNIKCVFYFISAFLALFVSYYFMIFMIQRVEGIGDTYKKTIILVIATPILIGIALEITNNLLSRLFPVKKMSSMDYLKEIPDNARTFVVMPVLISLKEQGLEYLNRLQKYYFANRQSNLYFALLADFEDSTDRCLPTDEELKNILISRINELNECYPSTHPLFSLFIRYRKWNESEQCYMGWERKRGKLEEFNSLLYGAKEEDTSFSTILCDKELLGTFKYVITLDADSDLIRDNAAKLVGLIDHPLNRAVMDPINKKVKEGYAIIQPSVKNHIVDERSSAFPKIFGGQTGVANYSTVISDIYQDIFQEGTYIGKGIYNVQVFHQILHKTIPENSVLSHDLLESCYVKTAFASTVNIMDNFPSSVLSYTKREHRWIRGDWQLFPWLFKKKTINKKSKWKIFDNLRRSLVPISKLLFIIINLALMPRAYYLWLPVVFFSDIINLTILLFGIIEHKINRPKLALIHRNLRKDIGLIIQRSLIEIVLTPYKAFIASDAILRTLYRMLFSKRSLLMWKTSETIERSIENTQKGYFLHMWSPIIFSAVLLELLMVNNIPLLGNVLFGALALAWALSFHIAYKISQPSDKGLKRGLDEKEAILYDVARRTWKFFRDFTTKENNWLCPDNYQIANKEKITCKTSPTNIGLQLLSILTARDFGFETLSSTLDYTENLLYTVAVLPKWEGHLFNWYNIKTLEVLNPQYISTVDSGNFFGDLIALKNGLLEQKVTPILSDDIISELRNMLILSRIDMELKEDYTTIGDFAKDIIYISKILNNREKMPWEDSCMIGELTRNIQLIEREIEDFELENINFSANSTLIQRAELGNKYAKDLIERIEGLCNTIDNMFKNVDFKFLYNKKRMLFHIGYHVSSQMLDAGCYDLMASESSLTSFLAIARNEVPVKHWYKLGRPITVVKGIPSFVSWSGTMFEYLMPNLVLRNFEGSVYAETSKAVVLQQMRYAKHRGIPWGISESQYYRFDLDSNYQYKAFGVPKLRLQPSLSDPMVVTPYATLLALDYASKEALSNLKRITELGAYGDYGYYEAIDFNGPDPINMTPYCIVKSFMTHHQGMSLVAINNFLHNGIMRRRFHAEPLVKATEVLLEEKRQTYFISISKKGYAVNFGKIDIQEDEVLGKRYVNWVAPQIPAVNYISNNNYSLMITSDGDGFSNYKGMMLNRWRPDVYANTGNYIYIKDIEEGKLWSTAYHPTKTEPDEYQVIFSPYQSEFRRRDKDITTHTSISLSPNHNLDIRKVKLTNHGKSEKLLEITSYLEVVGDSYLAELSHPAFNKLFVESEFIEEQSIFLSRRRSNGKDNNPYLMHMAKYDVMPLKSVEYENDRLKFIGRNNTVQNPDAVVDSISLSNNAGFSNDPIMSLRVCISLGPKETACITFISGVCSSKEEAVKISDELSVSYRIDDVFEKFRLQSEMELKYLNITSQQINAFQDIISPIYYPSSYYRGPIENIRRNWKNQSYLWRFGVSGDNPIMLLRVNSVEEVGIIKDVLKAYEYLRINHVKVDLIILSEANHGYMQELTDLLNDLVSTLKIYDEDIEKPSLFILHSYQMIPAEMDMLFTVARIVFSEKTGIYFRNIKEALKETVVE